MWRRKPIAYSQERVERLRAFADLLIEAAVLRRERVQLVERIRLLLERPELLTRINKVVCDVELAYPGYTVSVSLMDDMNNTTIDDSHNVARSIQPWNQTFCQYSVASARPFQVTDSLTDLVVCDSPNASRARSYNGVPLVICSWAVGVLCIYADTPRDAWEDDDQVSLLQWAGTITAAMERELASS